MSELCGLISLLNVNVVCLSPPPLLCIMIHLIQSKPTKCTHFIISTVNSYMFWASVAHQGVHSCVKQSFDLSIISSMWNCRQFINVSFLEMDMCTENYKSLNYKNFNGQIFYNFYNLQFYNFQFTYPCLSMLH